MHLVKNVLEVEREDIFAEETLHFDGQIHLTEVEEPYRWLIGAWQGSGHLLVKQLWQNANLSVQVRLQRLESLQFKFGFGL